MSQVEIFDISQHIVSHGVNKSSTNKEVSLTNFESTWKMVKEHFNSYYDQDSISPDEKEERQELEHNAIKGDPYSEQIILAEIESFLRENNLLGTKYPNYYESLAHACFQEIYRFGSFYKWNLFPESPSAVLQGDEQWYKIDGKFVKQDEKLRNEEHIYEIIRALQVNHPGLKINEANPYAEFDMDNGIRVTVVIPPRSYKPTIVFRRFIVSNYSYAEQAKKQTISSEDIKLLQYLTMHEINIIIAGPVESGKSTLLKTVFAERDPEKEVILIETNRESFLKLHFPDRLIHEFYPNNGSLQDVINGALKVDHKYGIYQEVRGVEADSAISMCERGASGLLMTYHITDPADTPIQLARHITDAFPARNEANEVRRIANQLDIGITMNTFKGNKKKVTSIYEICYDIKKDKAWINYLMKYDKSEDKWQYNSKISENLYNKIAYYNQEHADYIAEYLRKRSIESPIVGETEIPCIFKEE